MDVSFWSICLMKALRVLRFIEDSLLRGREKYEMDQATIG